MKRIDWFYRLLILVMIFLVGRLIVLQVVDQDYYRVLADENRVKLEIIRARRGVIYDRHGEMLVKNTAEGREYVYGEAMSQVLGYAGEISEEELKMCEEKDDCQFGLGDVIGKMGIEKEYDSSLRGEDGGVLVEQDAEGERLREIGRKEPVNGRDLSLTLDWGLQRKAYELMAKEPGAVVASDPMTGEILALVSSPGFRPDKLEEFVNDKDLPMFNRAIGGEYPPGSVFKVVTAIGALEEGKVDEETEIEDTGEILIGAYRFGNWYYDQYGRKEGRLEITRAIARSNDIFFYKLGEWLGMMALSDWAKYFGLGSVTEIDLPGEANGLIPDPEWKEEFKGEQWYLGDTYISAIGQGDILTTPLQVNQMMSVIAGGSKWCQPHLLKTDKDMCRRLDISQESLDLVTEGLKQVAETGGTAWPLFDFKVKGERIYVAGKTGTAEFGDPKERTHAWFTGFAPLEKPNIVVTVLMEAAGEGSDKAAPIVKDLLSYWFNRQ